MKLFALFFLFSLLAGKARADILFIDMNFNSKELATAREAAQARGEDLIVYPDVPPEDRVKIDKAKANYTFLQARADNLDVAVIKLQDSLKKNPEQAAIIQPKIDELNAKEAATEKLEAQASAELDKVSKPWQSESSGQDIHDILKKEADQEKPVTAIIISSHHTDDFFGTAGEFSQGDLLNTISSQPSISNSLQALYLWGCYGATEANTIAIKKQLPQLKAIIGFKMSAPLESRQVDLDYLRTIMEKEAQLTQAANLKEVKQMLNSVTGITVSNAAIDVGRCYVSNSEMLDLQNMAALCPPQSLQDFEKYKVVFDGFLDPLNISDTTDDYTDVPKDTQHSDLRSFYNALQNLQACPAIQGAYDVEEEATPSVEKAISLIYFKNVWKNYQEKYADNLKKIQDLAHYLNYKLPDPSSGKRSDILQFARALPNLLTFAKSKNIDVGTSLVLTAQTQLSNKLLDSVECVPPTWVEPPTGSAIADPNPECLSASDD